ncbi:hypothetical protein [Nitrosovibrio sp. Nv17]|jgi:hypothetical protein|uniref:hypothetical protein n=1 Tax=Nitrosovibrio sp. Nv17 TaxID=1855339 RepID=UPI00090899A8|nr:hypothetical protein [Nitrosovibrio sp. Nv17]SFW39560.1 hypothetical protein SAMN05216414_1348 [Nitrosovibrio sp. Nv17]
MDHNHLIDRTTLTWATGRSGVIRVHKTRRIPGKVAFYCFVEETAPGVVMIHGAERGPTRREATAIRHHLSQAGIREARWDRYDEEGRLLKQIVVSCFPAR